MKLARALVCLVACCASTVSLAQGSPKVEDKKGASYKEIERGLFFEARGGFNGIINPPALTGSAQYFSSGQAIGIDLGFDIGERVSPAIFFLAAANRMGIDYTGYSTTGAASGDFSAMTPGAAVKVRLVGFDDSQDVKRTWIYIRGGAGVTFYSPKQLLPNIDVLIVAGPGLEYYTRLRHFVIGVEANFAFAALTQTIGFQGLLTFKYAFPFQ
ncbi:MAG: adventurous gliding motility protein CglE [Myxococcaceae bacterium]